MRPSHPRQAANSWIPADGRETVRRAFKEFLTLPTLTIIGFLLMASGTYVLDGTQVTWLEPARAFLKTRIFTDPKATSDLLRTVASGLITVTSITISLLLLALQQATGFLTTEVCDQFLRRRINQLYFGFFVGLALFALVTLATVHERFNPVFGATLAFLLTVGALYLLILLLYTTVNQMRPAEIIEEIHRLTLRARAYQRTVLRKVRRHSHYDDSDGAFVKATKHGYVTGIDVDAIGRAARRAGDRVEVRLSVQIGSFVAWHEAIACVNGATPEAVTELEEVVERAVSIERQRDIEIDSAYGIEQLEMIAWTSISTAKSNPAPGLMTIRSLRDVLARWSVEEVATRSEEILPVVYDDNTFARLLEAFENLAVVSSESMQHQAYIEVVFAVRSMFAGIPIDHRRRAEDIVFRMLSVLGDHVLTAELDAALSALVVTLRTTARGEVADAVVVAQEHLRRTTGRLHSRSTRAEAAARSERAAGS